MRPLIAAAAALTFRSPSRGLGLALVVAASLLGAALGPTTARAVDTAVGGEQPKGVIIAAQTLRPGVVLDERHIAVARVAPGPGDMIMAEDVLGLETRVAVYRGQPIRAGDLGPPTLIRRNELIRLSFRAGPLQLLTEGRALDDGALGERVRVMNLDSRRTVYGEVAGPGLVETRP